jgi:hypothetical protein
MSGPLNSSATYAAPAAASVGSTDALKALAGLIDNQPLLDMDTKGIHDELEQRASLLACPPTSTTFANTSAQCALNCRGTEPT